MGNCLTSRNVNDVERGGDVGGSSPDEEVERPLWMRVLHRVPPPLLERKRNTYDPCVVSLGPYHHGQPQLHQLEQLKNELVNMMLKIDDKHLLFRSKILERIHDIRHFYGGVSIDEFDDDTLADMMLRDACVVLYCMELTAGKYEEEDEDKEEKSMLFFKHLGIFQGYQMMGDVLKLENQIPWWLTDSLISLVYVGDSDDGDKKYRSKEVMRRFLSFQTFGNFTKLKQLPWDEDEDEYNPLHLLEALHLTSLINFEQGSEQLDLESIGKQMTSYMNELENGNESTPCPVPFKCKWWWRSNKPPGGILHPARRPFHSVTELRAKGIYFKPSSSFLVDVRFSSYYLFGVLHLPVLAVSRDTGVTFSNIMALEMSPGTPCIDSIVTSYLTFMKSMIESSKDVKVLQENGIIVSFLEDNEEIVRMFKEVDSVGMDVIPLYDEIKIRINQHCDSKAKTWIAELINTNFRSPWTALALAAATFLLCLTFLQTYYTMNPRKTAT